MSETARRSKSEMNTVEVEVAVARHFSYRRNLIVPNLSWGIGLLHEADMLIVAPNTRYAKEVEIKVSTSDIRADLKKRCRYPNTSGFAHWDSCVRQCWFALPYDLKGAELVPSPYGILRVHRFEDEKNIYRVETERPARIHKAAKPLTEKQWLKLGHLAAMRIWSLKMARIKP